MTLVVTTVRGNAALSAARRARILAKVREVFAGLAAIDTRWIHLVATTRALTAAERAQLDAMLVYGPEVADMLPDGLTSPPEMRTVWVAPRLGTTSPWSSKATDIAHVCGLDAVVRIERVVAYQLTAGSIGVDDAIACGRAIADRMTESVIARGEELDAIVVAHTEVARRPLATVALGADGAATLRAASTRLGLALADDEIAYLVKRYGELRRDPTDVELMMFAQANSEHCRHKIFNAEWFVDGAPRDASLFALIKRSTAASPAGVLSAYKDNAAVVEGAAAAGRVFPDTDGVYRAHVEASHILGKVETHNHPTAISPHPGAATGSGGEIRDEGATGRGAKPKAGLVGFAVSDLRIPGAREPWEPDDATWIGKPARIASALDIMTDGPLGGAAYNNEFGRPAILGYFRTYERADGDGLAHGYHKPVMLAGGIGAVRAMHVQKAPIPEGAALIVLGGPAFLIGLGGGAASSLAQGASAEDLDFASVQRDNAEIERRCQEVIDRCWALGDANPIASIHDVGAGGLSNAMPELVHDAGLGARLSLRAIPTGEPELSPLELWCNEAQERYVLAIPIDRVPAFAALCARERAPWAQLGTAQAGGHLVVGDDAGAPTPVDLPLELVLGKPPRMVRKAETIAPVGKPLALGRATIAEALDRVLGLPTVADKSFLVTIGDRTVGGLIARDSMVGRFQVPVADCALTLADFDGYAGEVMAIGERPPIAELDAAAASRMAIGEAVTNLAAAPIGALGRIKLSCNWMAAAGHPGEDARLYAGVAAASELAVAIGVAIPVGKDSMSMRTVWSVDPIPVPIPVPVPVPVPVPAASPSVEPGFDLTRAHLSHEPVGPSTPTPRSGMDFDAEMAMLEAEAERTRLAAEAAEMRERGELPGRTTSESGGLGGIVGRLIDRAVDTANRLADRVAGAVSGTRPPESGTGTGTGRGTGSTRTVVSPVTLVVTAFGPVEDVRKNITPELRGDGELLLVDLGGGKARVGASCLAQVYNQLGDTPPDLDDPARLAGFYRAMQELVAAGALLAYHDRSDGGLVVAALEMAFASGLGLALDVTAVHADPFRALFAEELGAILEVAPVDVARVRAAFAAVGLGTAVHAIGRAVAADRVTIAHAGATIVDTTRTRLRGRWSHISHAIAARRDDEACAHEEHATRLDPDAPGLTAHVPFAIAPPMINTGARPRVAILREQGVNGQIEMAAAFTRAGFDAIDVHMTDLVEGRVDLADCRGAVACGGFSFGDVLGAGRGWAATFRYHARAREALAKLVARDGTFVLGVCNGCQMVADLADQLPGTAHWPRFVRNRSEQFEARVVLVELADSPSIFFRGMAGARLPIANAHGEGRALLTDADRAALATQRLVAARYVDGRGAVATGYPANPNGSPDGLAAVTTPDGRITIMMPHPERVHRTVQLSWHPRDWRDRDDSPWMQMFYNARSFCG